MVYRNYYIAREWVRQGHRAVIISSSYFHNFTSLPETKGLFTREIIDGIEYWWVKMPRYSQSRSLGRLFSIFLFPFLLLLFPFWRLAKPDTIIVSGPPHVPILNAWLWSRWLGATLVYEVRDIWPLTIEKLGGVSRFHPVIVFLKMFERLAYVASDRVVSVLALAHRHFIPRGMKPAKYAYIPNGVDIADLEKIECDVSQQIAKIAQEKFTVVYTGSLGIANNLDQLIDAAQMLKGDPHIHFVLVGDGPHRAKLQEKAKLSGNVSLFPSVHKKHISAILAHGHVCYVGLQKSPLFKHGISPNKLFDYLAASKPVVMAIDTEDDIVGRAHAGISVASCSPQDIAEAVLILKSKHADELNEIGKSGRRYLENHHTYDALAVKYVRIAEEGRRPVEEVQRWVVSPFWLGFWFVILTGLFFHLLLPEFFPSKFRDGMTIFLEDPHNYHRWAQELGTLSWSDWWQAKAHLPSRLISFIYRVTGVEKPYMFLPVLALLAGIALRLQVSILAILGVRGRWWPLLIALICTITPTSFSWMIYPHKDAFIVPGVLFVTWSLLAVTLRRFRVRYVIAMGIGITLILLNKSYFAHLLAFGAALAVLPALFYPGDRWKRISRLVAYGCPILFLYFLGGMVKNYGRGVERLEDQAAVVTQDANTSQSRVTRQQQLLANWQSLPYLGPLNVALKRLAYVRESYLDTRSYANTNFLPEQQIHSALEAIEYFPRAMQLVLLEPLPYRKAANSNGAKELVFVTLKLEMIVVYFFLLIIFWQYRQTIRSPGLVMICLAIPFLIALGYAVPNIGTINRYRFPFLLLVKLAGFAALWKADRHSWPGRLLMWVDPPNTVRAKRKLLFLVPDDITFIIQRLVMARAAQAGGYEVHVACSDLGHAQKIRDLGFIYHDLDLNRGGLNPFADFGQFVKLVFFLAKLRPDILQNVSIKPVIYGSTAGTIVGLKRIVNLVNGLGYAFERQGLKGEVVHFVAVNLYRNALALPGVRVIFQNPDDRQYFIDHRMVEQHKTILIRGSGVDMVKFAATPLPKDDVPIVLFVGRLLWSKGIKELVDASSKLRAEGLRFRLLIVGAPDDRNPEAVPTDVLKAWHEQGLLEWMGRQTEMPRFYREASIVCLPTNYREGLPLTLLEAASTGRPLVATDIPGCREVVQTGVNGFLVPPKNSEALAGALRQLLANPELRQKMGQASTELVASEFSSEHVQRQLLAVYDSLFDNALPQTTLSPVSV